MSAAGRKGMANHFAEDTRTAFAAKAEAQRIAFAPIVFQTCRVLLDSGLLELVHRAGNEGMTLEEAAKRVGLPRYGTKVLLEAGVGAGLFCLKHHGHFTVAKLGHFILRDPMTRVNMDFVHEVCYRGMYQLDAAIRKGRPAGLKTLGRWPTVYQGLTSLPAKTRKSWLTFDHYYSDMAFPAALPLVFKEPPKRLLDVGGNTGRWAVQCARYNPDVHITIADLPRQLALTRRAIRRQRLLRRVDFLAFDALDESQELPGGHDALWMSQFLDCFSERQIVSILRRAARALRPGGVLYILELLWDRQHNDIAAFCLQQTSLYFTCIANGCSQMYHSADLLRCIAEGGFKVVEQHDQVGRYHTLLKCRMK